MNSYQVRVWRPALQPVWRPALQVQLQAVRDLAPAPALLPSPFSNLDIQSLDLLVQRRERNMELLRGIRLIPVAALQLLDDDPPLDVFENVEQRRIRIVLQQRILEASSSDVSGQQ